MIEYTETEPPVDYEWWLTGPQGARFALFPITGVHTAEDVDRAKRWLRHNQDVVSIQIRWKKQGDDLPNPEKIPDEAMISHLRVEIGKLESEIQRLEDQLKNQESELAKEARKKIQGEETYKQLKEQLNKAKKMEESLRKQISDLVLRLNHDK